MIGFESLKTISLQSRNGSKLLVPGIVEEMSIIADLSTRGNGLSNLACVVMTALKEFLNEIFETICEENYEKVSKILSIEIEKINVEEKAILSKRKQSVTIKMRVLNEISAHENLEVLVKNCGNSFDLENKEIWNLLISSHLKVLKHLNSTEETNLKRFFNASNEQINVVNNFLRIFVNASQLPLLYVIGGDCWKLAAISGSSEAQEQAARAINKLFIACITERSSLSPQSRKWGTYRIAALLLRVYFHLGQLNLVQNVLKALKACELPGIDEFPRAHTVTFNYFLGRYHYGREEFESAETCFMFCFDRLRNSDSFSSHFDAVLHFLIPIKLILHLSKPTFELISMFKSEQNRLFYANLVEFISAGDLESFKSLINQNYKQLIKADSYSLYEKLILLIIRQRIRRIHLKTDNSTRISLNLLHNLCDKETTLEDVTCFVANLISRGLIRGYISEEKRFLVLSAQNPFPNNLISALCDK